MGKFYTMGCYTDKGLAGFVNNPSTNRGCYQSFVQAGGAKNDNYSLLRLIRLYCCIRRNL